MKVFEVRNVNDAVTHVLPYLLDEGIPEESRNGKVLVAPGPVTTIYTKPEERVLFSPLRDANPFFHLMESLWMLRGRCDLAWPVLFNKRFLSYSDDAETVHGAYGFRWRNWFNFDQLEAIAFELRKNPNSRRAVLSMWSAQGDLTTITSPQTGRTVGGLTGKDVPCNTHAYFDIRGGKLNMTVCCRSNDAIWGAYGANVVHFSILLEYMAALVDVPMGVYRQMSNNFHAYTDIYNEDALFQIAKEACISNFYTTINVPNVRTIAYPMFLSGGVAQVERFDNDLRAFMDSDPSKMFNASTEFFRDIIVPMFMAWMERREKLGDGLGWIEKMPNCDWRLACELWINRRKKGSVQ